MKRFQDLLADDSHNQYGLKYTPIISINRSPKNIIKNDQEKPSQKVEIFVKSSNKKSTKLKVQKSCKVDQLKQVLQLKTQILPNDQILYLNGRQISEYFSITFNQSQILHVSSRKSIVNQNQHITVTAQISVPLQMALNGQKFNFLFKGRDKLKKLQELIAQKTSICNPQNSFQINFLESGRLLDKSKTFNENKLITECNIVCLYSQNPVETKFLNQFCESAPQKIQGKLSQENFDVNEQQEHSQNQDQKSFQSLKFKKEPLNSQNLLVQKPKKTIYTRIQRKSQTSPHSVDLLKPAMKKRKSEAISMQSGTSGFKKKRAFTEDQKSQDSHLIRKIVVRKSKQQIEKLFSDNSLLHQSINEEQEKKSFVSSSSSDQRSKEYIPIRQQKQYRPCPLIPQRKMPQSQKMKINLQLQKLFGLEPKNSSLPKKEQQSNDAQIQKIEQNDEPVSNKSRLIIKNPNIRSSISAKELMIKALKDRKSNRYAEEKMYDGD